MSEAERKTLISQLENRLNAKVLVLFTGDRPTMETRIAPDILPLVAEHLTFIGPTEELTLFLYTAGGDSIVGWGLVNMLREYCKRLTVLVPFRALSCGTLIALGADKIVMGKHAFLGPIDPSVQSPFNPTIPGLPPGPASFLPVSVEDMVGFIELATKQMGLRNEESMIAVLNLLAKEIHPLALGAVFRAREQSGSLAKRLMLSHSKDSLKAERIINRLTQELPTHNYLIGRTEAKRLELDIVEASEEDDKLMWQLYEQYKDWFRLTNGPSLDKDLGTEQRKRCSYDRAAIESLTEDTLFRHVFTMESELSRIQAPVMGVPVIGVPTAVQQVISSIVFMGWVAHKD